MSGTELQLSGWVEDPQRFCECDTEPVVPASKVHHCMRGLSHGLANDSDLSFAAKHGSYVTRSSFLSHARSTTKKARTTIGKTMLPVKHRTES